MLVTSALVVLLELALCDAYEYEYTEAYYDNSYRDYAEEPIAYGPGGEHDNGRVRRFGDSSTFGTPNPGNLDDIRGALQQIMPGHKIDFLPDLIKPKIESTNSPTLHLDQFEEETPTITDLIESVAETVSEPNLSSDVSQMTPTRLKTHAPARSPSRRAPSRSLNRVAGKYMTRGAVRSMTHMPDRFTSQAVERTLTHMPDRFTSHPVERTLTHIPDRFTSQAVKRTSTHIPDRFTSNAVKRTSTHIPDRFTSNAVERISTHIPDRFTSHAVERTLTHIPDRFTSHAVERTLTHIPDRFTSQEVLNHVADRFTIRTLRRSTLVPVNTAETVKFSPNALEPRFTWQNEKQTTLSEDELVTLQDYPITLQMRHNEHEKTNFNLETIENTQDIQATSTIENILNTKKDSNQITHNHDSRIEQTVREDEIYEEEEKEDKDRQSVVSKDDVSLAEFTRRLWKDGENIDVSVTDPSQIVSQKIEQYLRENEDKPAVSSEANEKPTTVSIVSADPPKSNAENDKVTMDPPKTDASKSNIQDNNNTEKTGISTTKATTIKTTTTRRTTTTTPPNFDIDKFLEIIANLTYDYDTNLTQQVNETLIKLHVPTCGGAATEPQEETTVLDYDSQLAINRTLIAKCFVCGLDTPGIPYEADCADAFAGDFLPLVPIDPIAKSKVARYRKYCRYGDVRNYHVNASIPRSVFGRWTGGCSVRWTDLSGIYTQRSCRNRKHATTGLHFASKRMAKLEMALAHTEVGCIVTPVATLLPLSRGISLYARFHACVCNTNWCNGAARPPPAGTALAAALLVMWMRLRWLSG